MGKIASLFKWVVGLLKGSPKPVVYDGATVVSVQIKVIGGKKYKITTYSNGKNKKEPYDEEDPSNINDFLDDVSN